MVTAKDRDQTGPHLRAASPRSVGLILAAGVFLFYLATLAPTVLWGDDAFFQWSAVTGYLQPDGGGHWLHFTLARLFTHLPIGDPAYRVNLLSAVSGAITILLIFASGRSLNLSNTAAAAAALSLAVAHTFWTHAVRAEVYTVFTLMLALVLWLLVSWRDKRSLYLIAAVFLLGPILLSHQMALLLLPPIALLLWLRRDWLQIREWASIAVTFIVGLGLAAWIIQLQVGRDTLLDSVYTYFTQSGSDFSGSIFSLSLSQLPADAAFWLGMLGLQFVGPALILGVIGFFTMRNKPGMRLFFLTFYSVTVIFAATYRVNDRYVFFLPGYLVFALMVGRGWETFNEIRPFLARVSLPLLVLTPILTYALLPPLVEVAGVSLPGARHLPGREPASYFLWPAKNGYTAAADFGRSTLNSLPPDSILIADHTPYETLNYMQQVEGIRPDIRLIKVESGQDLAAIIDRFQKGGPIYLADNNPRYYNLDSLPETNLVRDGFVYWLENE